MMQDFTAAVVVEVMEERSRQDAKWGEQNHDPARWLMILGEEFGEACEAGCRAVLSPPSECYRAAAVADLRKELIHVAAVAVAAVECLDRPHKAADIVAQATGRVR